MGHFHEVLVTTQKLRVLTLAMHIVILLLSGCATPTDISVVEDPLQLGREAFQAGELETADEILSRAIDQTPDRADLLNARGYVRMYLKQPHEAGMDFARAIRIDPANARYRSNLAVLLLETGNLAEALIELDRVVAMTGPSSAVMNHQGLAKSRLGRYKDAVADFTVALEHDSGNAQAYVNRGVAYAKLGARAQAMADFERALMIDAQLRQAYESRGLMLLVQGEFQGAIKDFTKAIALGATDGLVFYNRAMAFSIRGKRRLAEEDYQTACRLGVPQGCLGLTDITAYASEPL